MKYIFIGFLLFFNSSLLAKNQHLLRKIFTDNLPKRACKVVDRGGSSDLAKKTDPSLAKMLASFLEALDDQSPTAIMEFFHPRLKASYKAVRRQLTKLEVMFGEDLEFSIYRLWALRTSDGDPGLVACSEDKLALGPHYGYDLQFGLWLQVRGKKDLGRLYASIVPHENGWRLGAWFFQQWTYLKKDPEKWVDEALSDAANGRKFPAYVKLDLVSKLLDGGGYVFPAFRQDVTKTRDSYFSEKAFKEHVSKLLKNHKVLYVGSLFGSDGAALLVRLRVSKETKTSVLKAECFEIGKILLAQSLPSSMGGVRCSYVTKNEDPSKPGRLGSRYLSRNKILKHSQNKP